MAVLVTPWLATAVPWFSLALGALLQASGARVTFVLDSLPFGDHPTRFGIVLGAIRRVLSALPEQFEVLEVTSARPIPLNDDDLAAVDRLAELNAVWALRGELDPRGRSDAVHRFRRQLSTAAAAVGGFLAGRDFDGIVVPGGVYGSSGIWSHFAKSSRTRLASFDSGGRGLLTVAANGIACQLQDIPRAQSLLKAASDEAVLEAVRAAANGELGRRREGKDRFASQVLEAAPLDAGLRGAVLIALNSPWDSAALGLHQVFENSARWVIETVAHLLEHTKAHVVVRQHPAERFESARSTDDYLQLLRRHFGSNARVAFVAAADPVNSYDLLDTASAVVVYTSTLGVEAALNGKVVVTASSSYYSSLGFVWHASTLEQYNSHLSAAVAGRYSVSEEMRGDALMCYYLTQCCNWLQSPLSPEGYEDWIEMPFDSLSREPAVRLTCTALREDLPIAYLVHRARMEDGLLSTSSR